MSVGDVGIVGAGTMGAGIAQVCATAGHKVLLVDVSADQLKRGGDTIAASLAKLEAKRRLPRSAEDVVQNIRTSTEMADLGGVDLVIEAVFEDPAVKIQVFRELDRACAPRAILASNTSSIPITQLAAATGRPEQVVGMHFMNPVPLMALVEVVRGLRTSEATVAAVRELAGDLGKTPVESRDVPGFIANRVLMPMINEAAFALYEGVASAEDIDTVMRLGMNHPMGPLALADLIGLDVCLAILELLQRDLGDDKYRPAPPLRQYVHAGWLGRKSGRGFYRYD
ncbi:MAG: 3-hydroxybutyryl-CoA dehydrogenase [Chloroflexota bacterium]|nr:3-hydroxybutyryl-CoA dehydrogenase [Chloroflexota bacterium]